MSRKQKCITFASRALNACGLDSLVYAQHSSQALGRSRGGLTTKIHTLVEVADKAFDADTVLDWIVQHGAAAVIPPRAIAASNANSTLNQYKHRNLITRCFFRLKHVRRIATRYDKLASRFTAFIALVPARGTDNTFLNVTNTARNRK